GRKWRATSRCIPRQAYFGRSEIVTQGMEPFAPVTIWAKVLRPSASAASLPALREAPVGEIDRAYSVAPSASLRPTDSPSHGSSVSHVPSDHTTDCGSGTRARGSGIASPGRDDIDHVRPQFATGKRPDVPAATSTAVAAPTVGRTGARSARPPGLPHDALLLPVDAHASSRPSWSCVRLLRTAAPVSGR